MNRFQKKIGVLMQKGIDLVMGNGLMQDETTADGEKYVTPGISEMIRQAGAESCVLLKNRGVLPLDPDKEIAVFGRCQLDWFFTGYGSGGDVHAPYRIDLMEGLDRAGAMYNRKLAGDYQEWTSSADHKAYHGWWGHWPYSHPEMPLAAEQVREAAASAATAVVVIGRAAGEDRENVLEQGSYYLTDEETAMLDLEAGEYGFTANEAGKAGARTRCGPLRTCHYYDTIMA